MMKTSPRPKARTPKAEIQGYLSGLEKEKSKIVDARRSSPKPSAETSPRPKANQFIPKSIEDRSTREMKKGGKVAKMAMGGTCRGMGAATKGGKYSKAG